MAKSLLWFSKTANSTRLQSGNYYLGWQTRHQTIFVFTSPSQIYGKAGL